MLIFICGKGGSGKDTLMNLILSGGRKDIKRLVLYTTRPKRDSEVEGVSYYFKSVEDFSDLENKGFFIETRSYDTVEGIWRYGTPLDVRDKDKVYITVGPYGQYTVLKERLGDDIKGIYLEASVYNCIKRMLERSNTEVDIIESCRRIYSDSNDYRDLDINKFDYIIDTNKLTVLEEVVLLNDYINTILQKDK